MDIQIATLCDFAADYNGKMVVSGTIDVLAAPALPVVQPHCCLALRLCITPEDNGPHKFSVNIIDGDGKSLSATSGHVKICDKVILTARAVAMKDITKAAVYMGMPARPMREEMKKKASLSRLPKLVAEVKELRRRLDEKG